MGNSNRPESRRKSVSAAGEQYLKPINGAGRLVRIVLLGDHDVGKSSFCDRFVSNKYEDKYDKPYREKRRSRRNARQDPICKDSQRKTCVIDRSPCLLDIVDTKGKENHDDELDAWIREGDGFIIMFDLTSKHSFQKVKRYLTKINEVHEDARASERTIICGNKQDLTEVYQWTLAAAEVLVDFLQTESLVMEVISFFGNFNFVKPNDIRRFLHKNGLGFYQVSAKTGHNVEESFAHLIRLVRLYYQSFDYLNEAL